MNSQFDCCPKAWWCYCDVVSRNSKKLCQMFIFVHFQLFNFDKNKCKKTKISGRRIGFYFWLHWKFKRLKHVRRLVRKLESTLNQSLTSAKTANVQASFWLSDDTKKNIEGSGERLCSICCSKSVSNSNYKYAHSTVLITIQLQSRNMQ